MPYDFWNWEDPEEQRKRHAAEFAERAAEIKANHERSQLQEHVGGLLASIRKPVEDVWNAAPSFQQVAQGSADAARAATSWMDPVLKPATALLGTDDMVERRSEMQSLLDRRKPLPETATAREVLQRGSTAVGGVLTAPPGMGADASPEDTSRYRDLYDEEQLGALGSVGGGVKVVGAVFGNAANVVRGAADPLNVVRGAGKALAAIPKLAKGSGKIGARTARGFREVDADLERGLPLPREEIDAHYDRYTHGTDREFERMSPSRTGMLGPGVYVSPPGDEGASAGFAVRGVERAGANVRPVLVPRSLRLLGRGEAQDAVSLNEQQRLFDAWRRTEPPDVVDRIELYVRSRRSEQGDISTTSFYDALRRHMGSSDAATQALSALGYDGIANHGATGTVIFPQSIDKIRNAFTGEKRGAFLPIDPVGGALGGVGGALGAIGGAAADDATDEDGEIDWRSRFLGEPDATPSFQQVAQGSADAARAATSWMDPVLKPATALLGTDDMMERRSEMQSLLDRREPLSETASVREALRRGSAVGGVMTAPRDLPPDAAHEDQARYRELYDADMLGALGSVGGGVKIAGAVFGNAANVVRGPAAQKVAKSYGVANKTGPVVNLDLNRFVYHVFDDLAPVRDMMKGLTQRLGRALTDNENAYEILRLGRASNEIGDAWYRQHVGDSLGGLQRVSGSVAQGRADLNDYLRAVDAIDKDAVRPGRNYGGFTAADAQQTLVELQQRLGPQAYADLEQAAGKFHQLGHFLLQKKVDAGLVSQQLAADLMQKYPRYMPIQVIDWLEDNLSRTSAQVGKVGGAANDIKNLTDFGTARAAEEPLQAYYRMAQRTAMMEAKNKAGLAIVDASKSDPILQALIRPVTHGVQRKPGEELLQVRRGGDVEQYYIDKAMKPFVDFGTTVGDNIWNQMLGPIANVTRKAAIAYNPVWGAGQFVMDSLTFIMKEGGVFNAGKSLGNLKTGLTSAIKRDALYDEAARSGALPGSIEYASGKPGSYEGVVRGMTGRDVTDPKELFGWLKDGLAANLKGINETLDSAVRLAEYSRIKQAGGTAQKAALGARDVTIDPSRGGHVIRQINAVVPFFNVSFQGAAYLPRLLTNADPAVRTKAMTGIVTGAVLPAMALEVMNERDPRYKDVPDFDKDRGLIIMSPWGQGKKDPLTGEDKPPYFLVRTGPFTPFVLLGRAMAREAMQAGGYAQEGADLGKLAVGLSKSTSPVDATSPIEAWQGGENFGQSLARTAVSLAPAGVRQAAEVAANYDTFRDRNIVPRGLEHQPAERQFTENTSLTARKIGEALNAAGLAVAPAQIDHLLRAWGGAADAAVGISDAALGATGIAEKDESQRLQKLRRDAAKTGISDEEKARLEGEIAREMLIKADRDGSLKNTPVVGGLLSRYYREQGGQSIEDRGKALDRALLDKKRDTGPVAKELERLGVSFSDVKDEIGGVKLTRSQNETYRANALAYREKLVGALVDQDFYKEATDKEKGQMLKAAMTRAAGWASQEVLPGRSQEGVEFPIVGDADRAVEGYLNAQRARAEYDDLARNERFRNIDPDEYDEAVQDISELQRARSALGEVEGEIWFLEKYGELRFARAASARETRRWRERAKRFREDNPDFGLYIESGPRTITRRGLDATAVARMAGL